MVGDTFEQFQTLEGSSATGALVGNHSTDSAIKNLGRCAVMERTGLFGVDNMALVEEVVVA